VEDLQTALLDYKRKYEILLSKFNALEASALKYGISVNEEGNIAEESETRELIHQRAPRAYQLKDTRVESIKNLMTRYKSLIKESHLVISYKNLSFSILAPKPKTKTVGTVLKSLVCGSGPKVPVNILQDLSGKIKQGKLTLVIGPPGINTYPLYLPSVN